ncbi:hypothetical protein GCM10025883_34410 [Mobilicoccus caccae]|uniref:Uncharacterized protein n=1 Tax=Mobilicoccus caccae TaxID=1859295 RepID=A0ABQ6IUQ7_9MICO|nr:hypothetical protein [Mobilicoccus caccae]GMA41396.1 hypothetical protein GCM10025883_34410 [Mobilicoccus caccae]
MEQFESLRRVGGEQESDDAEDPAEHLGGVAGEPGPEAGEEGFDGAMCHEPEDEQHRRGGGHHDDVRGERPSDGERAEVRRGDDPDGAEVGQHRGDLDQTGRERHRHHDSRPRFLADQRLRPPLTTRRPGRRPPGSALGDVLLVEAEAQREQPDTHRQLRVGEESAVVEAAEDPLETRRADDEDDPDEPVEPGDRREVAEQRGDPHPCLDQHEHGDSERAEARAVDEGERREGGCGGGDGVHLGAPIVRFFRTVARKQI